MRGPGAHLLLERALLASASAAGVALRIDASRETDWHSATFQGARHVFEIASPHDAALDDWLTLLPEHEFTLAGHLVADLVIADTVRCDGRFRCRLEALTVVAA